MSKKRKLKVKIKNKNKNQNIIHIKIDNSKKTKSRSNQNQKQHQPSIPNIIIQSPQTQPDYSNILYQMLQNNEKRHASIPIPTYTQQPIKNTNVTPQFTQTEQSSLNILPSIHENSYLSNRSNSNDYDYSTISSQSLATSPSLDSYKSGPFTMDEVIFALNPDYNLSEIKNKEDNFFTFDDIYENNNSLNLSEKDQYKEPANFNDILNYKRKNNEYNDNEKKKEALNLIKMQNEDFNVNKIDIPIGKNEFESIIDIQEPINVAKDDENRKETPEEQQQRLQEERLQEENISKKKHKETDKEKYFRKAQDGNDKYVKKYIEEYIIKGKNNNDTGMLNDEDLEIYKRYRKIKKPNGYNTTKVPTIGAVVKFYERNPL